MQRLRHTKGDLALKNSTAIALALCAVLGGCASSGPSTYTNPYGPVPSVGFGPANGPYGASYQGQYGPAPTVGPYGPNALSNWGPYGGLGGWGIPFNGTDGRGGGRGK